MCSLCAFCVLKRSPSKSTVGGMFIFEAHNHFASFWMRRDHITHLSKPQRAVGFRKPCFSPQTITDDKCSVFSHTRCFPIGKEDRHTSSVSSLTPLPLPKAIVPSVAASNVCCDACLSQPNKPRSGRTSGLPKLTLFFPHVATHFFRLLLCPRHVSYYPPRFAAFGHSVDPKCDVHSDKKIDAT